MIRPRDSLPSLAPAPSRDFPALHRVLPFTLPYRTRMVGAMLALLVASAAVLGVGQGLGRLVDDGFKSGDGTTLARAVLVLIGVIVLLAGSTFCRFYFVSWIGERVVADIRRAVFDRVIALSPAYFESADDQQLGFGEEAEPLLEPALGMRLGERRHQRRRRVNSTEWRC